MTAWRRALVLLGSGLVALGLSGLVLGADARPVRVAVLLVGSAVLHDGLVAPALLAGGLLLGRVLPGRGRAATQAALVVAGSLLVVSLPVLLHGRA